LELTKTWVSTVKKTGKSNLTNGVVELCWLDQNIGAFFVVFFETELSSVL
jgi:hypothetical protein